MNTKDLMEIFYKLFHKKYIVFHTIYLVYFSIYHIFHVFHVFAIGFHYITYFTMFTTFHNVSQNTLRKYFLEYYPLISLKWQHCRIFNLLPAMLAERIPIATLSPATILTAATPNR